MRADLLNRAAFNSAGAPTMVPAQLMLVPVGGVSGLIKGNASTEPGEGLVPAYSASGQDVWIPALKSNATKPGLVLSSVGARCGKVFLANHDRWGTVANTETFGIADGWDIEYVWYLLNRESFWIKGGTAQPFVKTTDSLRQKVPYVPLTDQRRIADYLDRETAEMDAMDSDLNLLIEKLQERRQAVAISLVFPLGVPGDLTSTRQYQNLGYTDTAWLGDIVTPRDERNQEPFAQYLSLLRGVGVIRYEDKGDVGNKKPQDLTRCKTVCAGDYVLNSMNFGIGSYGISPYDGVTSNVYIIFTPDLSRVNSSYLRYVFFSDDFRQRVQDLGQGILEHRKSIPWNRLAAVRVPLPSIEKQNGIVKRLDRETAEIDSMIADAQRLKTVLAERRTTLISDVVTGRKEVPTK